MQKTATKLPTKGKPTIPEVVDHFADYLAKNPVWGSLHVVLDDLSVSDATVRSCIYIARGKCDFDAVRLGETLLLMSRTQRLRLPTMADRELKRRQNVLDQAPRQPGRL